MKTARYLSISTLGFCLAATTLLADPANPGLRANPSLGSFLPDTSGNSDPSSAQARNPYAAFDPNGVPLSVTQGKQNQVSAADLAAYQQQQQQVAADKDWLLRGYEQQLQNNSKGNASSPQSANLYYQISSNKELAKLAGVPDINIDTPEPTTTFHTSATPTGQNGVTLRADSSPAQMMPAAHENSLKPLITPLGAPEAAGMHNFYTALPLSMPSPLAADIPQAKAASHADQPLDTTDLDTPGMVAAKNDPLADSASTDLSLDMLPGESVEQARSRQDSYNTLSLPPDADQLHNQQAAALNPTTPPASAATKTVVAKPVNATPKDAAAKDPEAPLPVTQLPQINPVRAPIANPYDILNR